MNYLDFVKKYAVLPALFISGFLEASSIGIIGGEVTPPTGPAYAALISPTRAVTPLDLEPGFLPGNSGFINSVAMSSSGQGLIGGRDLAGSKPAYAALVSPSGAVTKLTLPGISSSGTIFSVVINNISQGLIGGRDISGTFPAYAALINTSTGAVMSLTPLPGFLPGNSGFINSVAINSSGRGLIGGSDNTFPAPAYAALISPAGAVTPLPLGVPSGFIKSVAINSSGLGLIGGVDDTFPAPAYAALINTSTGAVMPLTPLPGFLPGNSGFINSVAINSSGRGLIGGSDNTFPAPAYAALISPAGAVTPLPLGVPSGFIKSVAINSSGRGLIGGLDFSGFSAYAALVSPTGVVTPLDLAPGFLFGNSGVILSVAINSSGRGLIGGVDDTFPTPAYAALISPAGAVTPLSLGVPSGFISSVAINDFDQGLIGGRNTATGAAYAALVSPAGQVIPLNVGLSSGIITSALS